MTQSRTSPLYATACRPVIRSPYRVSSTLLTTPLRLYAMSRRGKRSASTTFILKDRSRRLIGPLPSPFAMSNSLEAIVTETKDRENSETAAKPPHCGCGPAMDQRQ